MTFHSFCIFFTLWDESMLSFSTFHFFTCRSWKVQKFIYKLLMCAPFPDLLSKLLATGVKVSNLKELIVWHVEPCKSLSGYKAAVIVHQAAVAQEEVASALYLLQMITSTSRWTATWTCWMRCWLIMSNLLLPILLRVRGRITLICWSLMTMLFCASWG